MRPYFEKMPGLGKPLKENRVARMKESRAKLEEVLFTPMQVRLAKSDLPHVMPVSLQTIISDAHFKNQEPLLRAKATQLSALRLRLQPDLAAIADEYRLVLEKYLAARNGGRGGTGKAAVARSAKVFIDEAVASLDALDRRRAGLKGETLTASAAPGVQPLTHP